MHECSRCAQKFDRPVPNDSKRVKNHIFYPNSFLGPLHVVFRMQNRDRYLSRIAQKSVTKIMLKTKQLKRNNTNLFVQSEVRASVGNRTVAWFTSRTVRAR